MAVRRSHPADCSQPAVDLRHRRRLESRSRDSLLYSAARRRTRVFESLPRVHYIGRGGALEFVFFTDRSASEPGAVLVIADLPPNDLLLIILPGQAR
jgi:hypothetical protein